MAIQTVTVYKVNGQYYPDGCEKVLTCGTFKSLGVGIPLALPVGAPITCDEDEPAPVQTELIEFQNGTKWWILYDGTSITELCAAASDAGQIEPQTYIVGDTVNAPVVTEETWVNPLFEDRYVAISFNGRPLPTADPGNGNVWFEKPLADDEAVFHNLVGGFADDDELIVTFITP